MVAGCDRITPSRFSGEVRTSASAACHAASGDDPVCMLCHMDRNPGVGNDPKTHGSRFKSQVGKGDFHDNPNSMCFNCHTNKGPAGGAGFCGYCHGPK